MLIDSFNLLEDPSDREGAAAEVGDRADIAQIAGPYELGKLTAIVRLGDEDDALGREERLELLVW